MSDTETPFAATRDCLLATTAFLRVRHAVRELVGRTSAGESYHWNVTLGDGRNHVGAPGELRIHVILGDILSPEVSLSMGAAESHADFARRLESAVIAHRSERAAKLRAELAAIEGGNAN